MLITFERKELRFAAFKRATWGTWNDIGVFKFGFNLRRISLVSIYNYEGQLIQTSDLQ